MEESSKPNNGDKDANTLKFKKAMLNKELLQRAMEGSPEGVLSCVRRGADVNYTNVAGETAFYLAAGSGHFTTLKLLKCLGAQGNKTTNIGRNALHAAIAENKTEVVNYLIDNQKCFGKFDVVTEIFSCVSLACTYADIKIVKKLLDTGFSMTSTSCPALHHAVLRGNVQTLRLMLKHCTSSEMNAKCAEGQTALHFALTNYGLLPGTSNKAIMKLSARIDVIRSLISAGCKISCKACRTGKCKLVNSQLLDFCRDLIDQRKKLRSNNGATSKPQTIAALKETNLSQSSSIIEIPAAPTHSPCVIPSTPNHAPIKRPRSCTEPKYKSTKPLKVSPITPGLLSTSLTLPVTCSLPIPNTTHGHTKLSSSWDSPLFHSKTPLTARVVV